MNCKGLQVSLLSATSSNLALMAAAIGPGAACSSFRKGGCE